MLSSRHTVLLLALLAAPSTGLADDAADESRTRRMVRKERRQSQMCFIGSCLGPIRDCKASAECADWLACLEECGDDQMLCPTVCGAFYQAPEVNAFTRCALDNGCIEIDFSALPPCATPEAELAAVGDIDGFWWVSAIRGHDYVLYDDCQRFVFTEQDARISVQNSTTVEHKGETRVVQNLGNFTRQGDGSLELIYDNWVGYRELYSPLYATEQAMVMHVCSQDTTNTTHDYGTLVLTRTPLDGLGEQEHAALEASLQQTLDASLTGFRMIGTSGCPNGPVSP